MPNASDGALAGSREEWRKLAEKELQGRGTDDLLWRTPEGIEVKPLYTRADVEGLPFTDTLPGLEPFVRGPHATM